MAMIPYRHFFGFQQDPFAQDLKVENLYPLPGLLVVFKKIPDLAMMVPS
jgi:hypothetical protein